MITGVQFLMSESGVSNFISDSRNDSARHDATCGHVFMVRVVCLACNHGVFGAAGSGGHFHLRARKVLHVRPPCERHIRDADGGRTPRMRQVSANGADMVLPLDSGLLKDIGLVPLSLRRIWIFKSALTSGTIC